jgi:hypothetical protein
MPRQKLAVAKTSIEKHKWRETNSDTKLGRGLLAGTSGIQNMDTNGRVR